MSGHLSSSAAARGQQRGAAARGSRRSQGVRARGSELHEPQFPPQHLVLFAAPRDLQLQHRVAAVYELADLRHRGVGQHLHDGGQLRVEGGGRGHVSHHRAPLRSTNNPNQLVRTRTSTRPKCSPGCRLPPGVNTAHVNQEVMRAGKRLHMTQSAHVQSSPKYSRYENPRTSIYPGKHTSAFKCKPMKQPKHFRINNDFYFNSKKYSHLRRMNRVIYKIKKYMYRNKWY